MNIKLLVTGRYREHHHAYDRSFDRKYGVDTAGTVALEELRASDDLKRHARRYEAADPEFFTFLLQRAGFSGHSDHLFVDLGSGKGRSLLLAALAGFSRVVGVELDPELDRVARRNIEIFKRQHPLADFIAVNGDATTFEFPPVPTLLFLNNPFDEHLLDKVLANVEGVHCGPATDFTLIYMHSNHGDLVRRRTGWEELDHGTFRSRRLFYGIFRWRGAERLV
ncbi:MAG TPA: hypothetical protein VF582_07495 [Allosphingosinicella sp.]